VGLWCTVGAFTISQPWYSEIVCARLLPRNLATRFQYGCDFSQSRHHGHLANLHPSSSVHTSLLNMYSAGTDAALHAFEGKSFEGHIALLLRVSDPSCPATQVLDNWLEKFVPAVK